MAGPDGDANAPSEAERELANRRRELELESDAKARDLKAQHKRVMDRLQQDREEWEALRREQKKEVADLLEKARRRQESTQRDAEALKATRRELEATKALAQDHASAKAQVKVAHEAEEALRTRLQGMRSLLAWTAFVAVAGPAAFLVTLLLGERAVALAIAGVTLAVALLLEWRRRKLASAAAAAG